MRRTCEVRISANVNQLLQIAAAMRESTTGKHTSKADVAERLLIDGVLRLAKDEGWDPPAELLS